MGFDVEGDLQLTADGRNFTMLAGRLIVAQRIKVRAQIFKGSWRYDLNVGIPYFDEILVAGPQRELVRRRFYDLIKSTEGVSSVTKVELRFDRTSATIFVDFECIANGEVLADELAFVSAS